MLFRSFYTIYNTDLAAPIEDEAVRKRFESKCEQDKSVIFDRIYQVEVERSYRIVGALETIANDIENQVVPTVKEAMSKWLKLVLTLDAMAVGLIVIVMFVLAQWFDVWELFSYDFTSTALISSIKLGLTLFGFSVVHFMVRSFSAKVIARKIVNNVVIDKSLAGKHREVSTLAGNIKQAFLKNTQPLRSIFRPMPVGWSMRSRRVLAEVSSDSSEFIQTMNDRYTKPSGNKPQMEDSSPDAVVETLQPIKVESN